MNIHEYQAKELLKKFGIKVPGGVVILDKEDVDKTLDNFDVDLYVVKAQIHAGGRGKAGGVKLTRDKQEAKILAKNMFGMNLITHQTSKEGQIVRRVYITDGCEIKKEYYLSIIIDRATSCPVFIASTEGGVDIEEVAENHPEKIIKLAVKTPEIWPYQARFLGTKLGFSGQILTDFVKTTINLYNAFVALDTNQIEINPLVLDENDQIIALDAKFGFDENALYRQKEVASLRDEHEENPLELRAKNHDLNYVKMDGNIGCMVNGAGLAMATMDIIKHYGASPANFLDVGGGADEQRVTEAFKIILSDENVKAILVNIFGGIMRCDIIANGIISAAKEVGVKIPLVVRLAGTNFELGKQILAQSGLNIIPADDLADAAQKVTAAIR
jgi:succinyl-CoA synthetase beta subunit